MHASRELSFASKRSFIPSVAIEFPHRPDHLIELTFLQLWIDRKRDNLFCSALALRKPSFFEAEVSEARLEMKRQRVVNRVTDFTRLEIRLQIVTPLGTQRVLVVNRNVLRIDSRRSHVGNIRKRAVVVVGVLSARRAQLLKRRQLRDEHRRLDRVELTVVADFIVIVRLEPAMNPKTA